MNRSSSGRVVDYSCPQAGSLRRCSNSAFGHGINERGGIMNNLTLRRISPIMRLVPRSTRSGRHRVLPCDLPTRQTLSTPLDRGSTVALCVVCFESGRATEATHQTRNLLCGCDQHIQQLEQHGFAALHRQRSAQAHGYMDRGAPPARGTAGLGDGRAGPSESAVAPGADNQQSAAYVAQAVI